MYERECVCVSESGCERENEKERGRVSERMKGVCQSMRKGIK